MDAFPIDVPEADLVDLGERLARTRWPNDAPADPWVQGTPLAYLQELFEYWATVRLAGRRGATQRI